MFEGWATEFLASYLGHFCDLQKEQLRISLWRAWRSGVSLENVSLRADAFDYLQLPFKLLYGRVGRVQAQVPWHALRSAPVVIELSDVDICLSLLDEDDMQPGPAGERAWAAKQAELAVAELQELSAAANGNGSGSNSSQAAADGVSGSRGEERRGMLWSFLQHLVTVLVNKLQLRVSNVHISLQDAAGDTVAGLRLQELRTVPLAEAERLFGENTFGTYAAGFEPGGRGVFHKQLALRGLSAYWAPAAAGSGGSSLADAAGAGSNVATSHSSLAPGLRASAMAGSQAEQLHPLLLPLDCTLQLATQVPGDGLERGSSAAAAGEFGDGQEAAAEGLRIHAAAVIHGLDLSLHHGQAADMLRFADSLAWLAARNRCAVFRPEGWQPAGSCAARSAAAVVLHGRRQLCRQLWQYAVNAVLAKQQGQRHGVPWLDAPTRRRLRLEYIRAYTHHLVAVPALAAQAPKAKAARGQQQRQQQPEGALLQGAAEANGVPGSFSRQPSATALATDASVLAGMERQLPLTDILLCRRAARGLAAARNARMAKAPAQVTPAKRPRGASDLALPAPTPSAQHPTAGISSSAFANEAAGPGSGTENGLALPAATAVRPSLERSTSAPGFGVVQDGVADSEKGYISWGLSKVAGFLGYMPHAEGSAELLEPTELDVRQLYEAVDFDPEREAPLKPAQRGVQVNLDCLVRRASILLRQPPSRAAVATAAGNPAAASPVAPALPVVVPGAPIAALELDHARLDVQLLPEAFSAGLVVSEVVGHDLVTNGPGVTEALLGRLENAVPQHHHPQQQQYLPMLRMKLHLPLEVSRPPSPTPQGSPRPSFEQHLPPSDQKASSLPTLDVLVQPLQLHYRPACLLQLQQVLPVMVRGGFHEHLLAAVNGLTTEARAAEKAGILQALGTPLDVLVKVLDVHLLLGAHDGPVTSPGAVLSTGPITFHSVRHQPQLSVEAALDLLRRQCRERAASHHQGGLRGATMDPTQHSEAAASAAAVMVVEQQLVYQQFEFRLESIQLLAVNADLPGSGAGVDTGSVRGGRRPGGEVADDAGSHSGNGSGSNRRQILQPLKLGGALKLHRITDDTTLTQVHCALHMDPITLSLTPVLVAHLTSLLLPGPPNSQPGTPPAETPVVPSQTTGTTNAAQGSSAATSAAACDAPAALFPVTLVVSGEGKRQQRLPAVVLHVRLSSLDASYFVQVGKAGKVEAHAHLSLLRAAATLQVYPAGVEAQVSLSGISLRDLSPEVLSLLPVGGPIPHLAKAITLEALSVAFDGTAPGGRSSTTEVHLQDLVAHGYAGEPGNFIARLHERRPTVGTIVVQDTPDALHTTVSLSNLVLGHSFLLRILALIVPGDEDGSTRAADDMVLDEEAGTPPAAAAAVSKGTPGLSPPSQSAAAGAAALALDLGWEVAGSVSPVGTIKGSPQAVPPQAQLDSASSSVACGRELNGLVVIGSLDSSPAIAGAAKAAAGASILEVEAAVPGPSRVAHGDCSTARQLLVTPSPASAAQPVAVDSAEVAQAAPQPQGRRVLTTVQLNNCRVVCKYRRGHLPTVLGSTGALPTNASFSAASAAAREALELHEDILALEIPCLSLQLPLGPPPLDATGRAVEGELVLADSCFAGEGEQGSSAVAGESEEAPFDPVPSVAGDSLADASSLTYSFASPARPSSRVRRATSGQSLYTSASSSDLGAGSSSQQQRQQQQQQGIAGLQAGGVLPPQPVLTASGLCLSLATAGLASRSMLPVLSIPSLELLCWHRVPEARQSVAVTSALWMQEGPASRPTNGSAAQQLAAGRADKVSASPAAATSQADSSSPLFELVACYSLAVGSVELGGHPSHVPMLGVLVEQVGHELVLLMRDASDITVAEGESMISSTSSPPGLPLPGSREQPRPSSAAGLGHQGHGPGPLWELDACVGLVAVSLLGSMSSSSCLRLEWEGLRCSASNTGSESRSCASAGLRSPGSKPLSGPADPAPHAASLQQPHDGAREQGAPVLLDGQISWRQMAVHVLRPSQRPPSSLDTPFAAAAHLFDASRAASGQALSDLMGPQAELLYHWSMGMEPSRHSMPTTPYPGSGARRSLSAKLAGMQEAGRQPSTEQEPSFFDPPSRLLAGRSGSSGISRYFSAADDDEFEDAASDWAEGASSPGGGSPRQPALLPLSLASPDYHPMLLLRLVGCGGEEGQSTLSVPAEHEFAPEAAGAEVGAEDGMRWAQPQEVLLCFERRGVQQQPELAQCSGRRPSLDQHRRCLQSQQEWAVVVGGVALQVHMEGWMDALACLQSYAAPGRQLVLLLRGLNGLPAGAVRSPQKSPVGAAAALTASAAIAAVASGAAAATPALGLGSPQQPQSQQQQDDSDRSVGLRVQLQRLTVAAVADGLLQRVQRTQPGSLVESEAEGLEDESTDGVVVPALSLTTAVTISCCAEAGGGLLVGLDIPMALLGVGVVPRHAVPAVVLLPLHDSLLGLRHAELSVVVQPLASLPGPLPLAVAAEAAQHSLPHTSVAAHVEHVSAWGSQRNLSIMAAFAQHAQQLAQQLVPLVGSEGEVDKGQSIPAAGPGGLFTLKLNLQKLAVLLSLAQHNPAGSRSGSATALNEPRQPLCLPVPLFELVASALTVDVHDVGVGWLEASVASRLQLDVFSTSKHGWEPVLEPWQCRLVIVTPTSGSAHHRHLGLSAQQGLEVTVTDTAAEAAGLLAEAFQPIPEVFDEPDMLATVLGSAEGAPAHLSAAWWLHNMTGATLEVWVVTPAQARAARHLTAPAMLTAPAGSKLALPVFAHGQAAQQQRHAGQPSASTGVAECSIGRGSRSLSGQSINFSPDGMLQPSHRTLLFFRLAGQGTPSGPVQMDRLEPSLHVVQSAELGDLQLRAKVVCEMQEGRFGGSTILLHSGVQVHNTTEHAIDVGVQTPMGLVMEPQPLGAVLPGKSLWLPVLRAEAGLLCIRPSLMAAGPSPLTQLPAEGPPHPAPRVPDAIHAPTGGAAGNVPWGAASSLPGVEAGSSSLGAPLARRPTPPDLQQAISGSVSFPTPHPALLYASGRLSPARASLDYSTLQQLEAAVEQQNQQAQHEEGTGGVHGTQAALGSVQGHQHDWSAAVALQQLLRQPGGEGGASTPGAAGIAAATAGSEGHRPVRQMVCHPALGSKDELPMIFSLGAVPSDEDGLIWDVTISPPLTLHNALPVPLDITLRGVMKSYLLSLGPNQRIGLHHLEAAQVESLALKALGYQPTDPIVPTPIPSSLLLGQEAWATRSLNGTGTVTDMDPSSHEIHALETLVQLNEVGHGNASVQVAVRHSVNTLTGMHTLRLGCTLWVYNLTGAPISLRQSLDEIMVLRRDVEPEEDLVPAAWVPPLSLGLASPAHRASSALGGAASSSAGNTPPMPRLSSPLRQAQGLRSISREGIHSMRSVPNFLTPMTSLGQSSITPAPSAPPGTPTTDGRALSVLDMPGLGEILGGEEGMARQVPTVKRVDSRARGITDSMEAAPVFEMPSRWPSMHGGLQLHRHRLKIQVRATQCKAPEGSTYWSDPVELDATVGGAAVVTAPAPLLPPASALPAPRAAYMMSVTAAQVPGSEGALALYLLPRYLLRNALDVPIQYKQQGTGFERELEAGAARPLRCADASRALRLCVRVQEAGWMWSGGFALDTPGDMFIKIRHRDRGVTMLVRVDVAASASGVLVVTLSHHPAGFAPYRIENCTTLTLHARQHRCKEQQDVLRPYCALNYAWDEPALPHKLVLELPGAKFLGIFQLDKVEQDVMVKVPAHPDEPERKVRVLVRAEGPTRVLSVLDVHRHCLVEELQRPPAAARTGALRTQQQRRWPYQQYLNSLRGVGGGGGDKAAAAVGDAEAGGSARAVPSGLLWEVSAELASVGVSLVSPSHELGYVRAGQLRTTVAMSAARFVVDLEVKTLQVDNPRHWVAHPVTLVLPAPASRLTSTMAAATLDKQRKKPALSLQLAVWQRRPAGVICVEHADLQVAPLGVFVEQQHALQLAAFLSSLSASFLPAAATGSSPSSGLKASVSGHLASYFSIPTGAAGVHAVHGVGAELGGVGGATLPPASRAASMYAGDLPSPGTAVLAGLGPEAGPLVMQLPRDLLALLSGQGQGSVAQGQKVYIDIMTAGPLDITVSFLPAPWDPQSGAAARFQTLQRLLSLADVEDAHLRLAGLELRHPLMGIEALAQVLQRHYMMALIPQMYKVVGAANVFGDPVRLVHHLGLGVWSFLASPAAGLVESARQRGPRQFVAGLVSGTQGLVANVVFAFSNAATKGSGAARKFIAVLGLDKYDRHWAEAQLRRQRVHFDDHLVPAPDALMLAGPRRGRLARRDDAGIFAAVMRGVVGVISEPIRGVDEGGLRGFVHGLKRGVLGFVVIPLASLLDMSARVAESIRRAVAGASSLAWVRPPRYVCPGELLAPYDWQEAMGRWLLAELDRQRLGDPAEAAAAQDAFVLCVPAAANGHYLVATTTKVLYIHAREPMWMPLVKWSARLVDLELATRSHSVLSMVALHAERTLFMLSMWDQLSDARARPRGPWSYLRVECESEDGAARFDDWVAAAMMAGQRRVTILCHAQVLSLG